MKLPPADVMPCPQLVSDLFLKGDLLKAERFEQSNASWIRQGDTTEGVHESSCSKLGEQSTKELAADAPAHRRRSDVDGYLRGPPVRSAAIERRRIRESLRRIGFLVDNRCVTFLYSRCHLLFGRRLSFERDHGVSDVGRIDRRKSGCIVFPSRPDHSLDCASLPSPVADHAAPVSSARPGNLDTASFADGLQSAAMHEPEAMSGMLEPVALGPGEGTTFQNPVGGPLTIKLHGDQTNGSMTVFESTIASFEGPPLHTHANQDEALYVIKGKFRFRLEEDIMPAPARSIMFIPRGTRHCFQNIGAEPGHLLVTFTPSGMEAFFERFASLPEGADLAAAFKTIGREQGMDVVGPPLAMSHPL